MKQEIDLHVIRSCTARLYFIEKNSTFFIYGKITVKKVKPDPNNYKIYKNKIELDLLFILADGTFKKEFYKFLAFSNFMISKLKQYDYSIFGLPYKS